MALKNAVEAMKISSGLFGPAIRPAELSGRAIQKAIEELKAMPNLMLPRPDFNPQAFVQVWPAVDFDPSSPPAHSGVALLDAPKPAPLFAHGPDPELEAHAALAKKLGVAVRPKLSAMRLQDILAEEGMTCYDKKAVHAYMDSRAGQAPNTSWFWFHALERHVKQDVLLEVFHSSHREYLRQIQGSILGSVYRDAIPLPVLLTIDKLMTRLGDEVVPVIAATFDLGKLRPAPADPFLAVLMRGEPTPMFIIERWDEPGFRGLKG